MANDITKRMNYFDRQFLRAKDFQDEQAYHIDRRRRHNRLLHTPGVAEGLDVEGSAGSTTLLVKPGTAIDPDGRDIVLLQQKTLNLRSDADKIDEIEIYILYGETETDSRVEGGVEGNTRMEEIPAFEQRRISPDKEDPPEQGVLLAKLKLKNGELDGKPDNTVRAQSGTIIGEDFTFRSLKLKRDDVLENQWPELSCSKAEEASLQGSLIITDTVGIGTTAPELPLQVSKAGPYKKPASGVMEGKTAWTYLLADNVFHNSVIWDANRDMRFGTEKNVGSGYTEIMRITKDGNVGMGTVSPILPLQVSKAGPYGQPAIGVMAGQNAWAYLFADNKFDNAIIWDVNRDLRFGTESSVGNGWSEKVRITKDGNVGMGTDKPDRKLTLKVAGTTSGAYQNLKNDVHEILIGVDAVAIVSAMTASDLEFRTKNTARMVVKATTGNVGIGIVNPSALFHVNGNAVKPGGGPWGTASDISLKKNVKPLKGALEKLLKLRGVNFEWKEPEKQGNLTGKQMGLVAQEAEEVFPEWVDTAPDGLKILTIRGFEALVIEALREIDTRMMALEKRTKS